MIDIFEGWLYNRASLPDGKYTPWHRRWCILRGNLLYLYTRRPDIEAHDKKLQRRSIDCDMATVATPADDVKVFGKPHAFKLLPKSEW